jgi:hypothetical protein
MFVLSYKVTMVYWYRTGSVHLRTCVCSTSTPPPWCKLFFHRVNLRLEMFSGMGYVRVNTSMGEGQNVPLPWPFSLAPSSQVGGILRKVLVHNIWIEGMIRRGTGKEKGSMVERGGGGEEYLKPYIGSLLSFYGFLCTPCQKELGQMWGSPSI